MPMAVPRRRDEMSRLIILATVGRLEEIRGSQSTTHTSVVDSDGLACAVIASAGYGSG